MAGSSSCTLVFGAGRKFEVLRGGVPAAHFPSRTRARTHTPTLDTHRSLATVNSQKANALRISNTLFVRSSLLRLCPFYRLQRLVRPLAPRCNLSLFGSAPFAIFRCVLDNLSIVVVATIVSVEHLCSSSPWSSSRPQSPFTFGLSVQDQHHQSLFALVLPLHRFQSRRTARANYRIRYRTKQSSTIFLALDILAP